MTLLRVLTALLFVLPGFALSQPVPPSKVMQEGEELVYNVRYGFINLGQVKIQTVSRNSSSGTLSYETKAYIDSYRGVPFVDLHALFESRVDSAIFSHYFRSKMKEDNRWDFSNYIFEYSTNRVFVAVGQSDSIVAKRETLSIAGPYNDGLSLFFHARHHLYDGRSETVPLIVKEEKVKAQINFKNERTDAEIDAIDYPVDVVYFDGNAEFTGVYGMSGGFEGWFSNDEARVPIKAKMKVIVGSVTIELMAWKRDGWTPPHVKG